MTIKSIRCDICQTNFYVKTVYDDHLEAHKFEEEEKSPIKVKPIKNVEKKMKPKP